MELNQLEISDLNEIMHSPAWASVLKLFKIYEERSASMLKTGDCSNEKMREYLGEFRAYAGLQTMLMDYYDRMKVKQTEEKNNA